MALVKAYDRNNNVVYVRDVVLSNPHFAPNYSLTPFADNAADWDHVADSVLEEAIKKPVSKKASKVND